MTSGTFGILIILATFVGPISAVLVTRFVDGLRDARRQRMYVFRALMRTRRMPFNNDYVMALNLVEVEFYNCNEVLKCLKDLNKHYGSAYRGANTLEDVKRANEETDRIKTRLLSAMAKVLRYSFGEIDLIEGGYVPQAWVDEKDEQSAVRANLLKVLGGQSPIFIAPYNPTSGSQILKDDANRNKSAFPPKPGD